MVKDSTQGSLAHLLDGLERNALRADVSRAVVEEAREATQRVLGCGTEAALTPLQARRAEAYYAAVVRRRTVRGSAGPRAAARFVLTAVVADLREAGRDGLAIWQELERGWGERMPADVLEEYRLRLCG